MERAEGPFFQCLGSSEKSFVPQWSLLQFVRNQTKVRNAKRQRQHLGGIRGSLEKTQKEQDKSRRAVGLCTRSVCVRNRNKSEVLEYKPGCLWVLTTHEEDAASVSLRTLGRITGSPLGCKQNHLGMGTFKNNWCVGHPKSLLHCLGMRFLKSPWKWKCQSLSHVQLFGSPWTVVHQAPLSMGFSKQEYWSGLPFPSPGIFLAQGSNPGLLITSTLEQQKVPLRQGLILQITTQSYTSKIHI